MPRRRYLRPRLERLECRTQPALLFLPATADTTLDYRTSTPAGSDPTVRVEPGVQALLQFDGVAQIPAGSVIRSANVRLWVESPAVPFRGLPFYHMVTPWSEATSTWYTFPSGGNGVQLGVEAVQPPLAYVPTESVGYQTLGGAGMTQEVQRWVNGTANRGLFMATEEQTSGFAFASREAVNPDRRPVLVVDYQPPVAPTYGNLVGQPPSARTAEWFTWQENLVARRLANVPAERGTTYYFSQEGDDFNGDGSADRPWRSLAKAQDVIDRSLGDVRLRFRGGDVWREAGGLNVTRPHVTVDSYGDGKAMINAFTHQYAGGWQHAGGNLWRRAEAGAVGWLREADNPLDRVYKREDSSDHVLDYEYSFFMDAAGSDPRSGGEPTLYLNAGDGVNPNALPGGLEATEWTNGWYVNADNVRIENLRVDGAGILPNGTGYGLQVNGTGGGFCEFVGIDLEFYYTGYHSYGHTVDADAGLFLRCKGGLNTTRAGTEGTTTFVSFSLAGGQEYLMVDCEVTAGALPSADWSATPGARYVYSVGVYQHNNSGVPALSIAVRTRYPDNPWQNSSAIDMTGPASSTLEGVRTFVVGETYQNIGIPIGNGLSNVAWINCTALATPVGSSPYPFLISGFLNSWVINGTFRADMRDSLNFGGVSTSWFNGSGPVNLRLENCRFEAYNLNQNTMTFLYALGLGPGPQFSVRNTLIAFDGTQAGRIGRNPDARWSHNAYKFSGGATDNLSGDAGAVLLTATPSDAVTPSLSGPLAAAGTNIGVTYDRTGAVRPAGRFDIGPVAAVALPAPASAAVTWGHRTAAVTDGGGVGWTEVRQVQFTFANGVDVYRQSLSVIGNQGVTYAIDAFAYDPVTRTAVWNLATPVLADRLTFFLDGVAAFRQSVLTGDANGDGRVNGLDLRIIGQAIGTANAAADVTGDGEVTKKDYLLAELYFGATV